MTPKGIAYAVVLGLGIAGTATLWVGQSRLVALRDELAALRAASLAVPKTPKKAADSQAEQHAAAPTVAAAEQRARPPATPQPPKRAPETEARGIPLLRVPASAWSLRNPNTPTACFENVLLAASKGDVATLKNMLTCDAPAWRALEEAHRQLPEALKAAHATPEELLASMVSVQIPGNMEAYGFLGEKPVSATETIVAMQTERRRGSVVRDATFVFRRDGDAWRLVVPPDVVAGIVKNVSGKAKTP